MAKEKLEIVENLNISNGGALKRVGALLIDLIIFTALMFGLSFITTPIFDSAVDYSLKRDHVIRETKRSYLVTLSEELTAAELADDTVVDKVVIVQNSVPFTKYAEATYKFYTLYLKHDATDASIIYDDEWYIENILEADAETSPFKRTGGGAGKKYTSTSGDTSAVEPELEYDPFLVPGTDYKVEEVNVDVINAFYRSIYGTAIKAFESDPIYQEVNSLVLADNIIRIVLSSSLVFLLLPLLLSYGQTLGKKALKLGLATTHGYRVSWLQLLVRYFVFLFVALLSNLWIPVLLPFISLTFMVFNKRGKSIHDLAASTRVVDLNKSVIYDNPKAYLEIQDVKTTTYRNNDINDEVFEDRFREDSGA